MSNTAGHCYFVAYHGPLCIPDVYDLLYDIYCIRGWFLITIPPFWTGHRCIQYNELCGYHIGYMAKGIFNVLCKFSVICYEYILHLFDVQQSAFLYMEQGDYPSSVQPALDVRRNHVGALSVSSSVHYVILHEFNYAATVLDSPVYWLYIDGNPVYFSAAP